MTPNHPLIRYVLTAFALPGAALALGQATQSANADTIYVCWDGSGDFLTIQEGIDAAVDGDEVVVCDGTYTGPGNKDLDFHGKAITVRSENGADGCVIDCEGDGRAFYFHNSETDASVVDGFTIVNGHAHSDTAGGRRGGAIHCDAETCPTVRNCVISGNTALDDGGGIYCWYESAPCISNCTITGNTAECGCGGGVWGPARIDGCTISGNSAIGHVPSGEGSGGGVWGAARIDGCTISGNSAIGHWGQVGRGGGVSCGDTVFSDCVIADNMAASDDMVHFGFGGGVYCTGDAAFSDCTFNGNTAGFGGGLWMDFLSRESTLTDCTFCDNVAIADGGGIFNYYGWPTLTGCVFVANSALARGCGGSGGYGGGAIYNQRSLNVNITNCTFVGNQAKGKLIYDGGGAINNYGARVTVVGCTFDGNTAWQGGAIHSWRWSELTLVGCTLGGNSATVAGGGLCSIWPRWDQTIANCVFSGNSAEYYGGGLFSADGPKLSVANSIFWGNSDGGGFGESAQLWVTGGPPVVRYCCIRFLTGDLGGVGNIGDDPLFVDPNSDYHLSAGSPCIDAGCNWAVPPDYGDLDDDGDVDEFTPLDLDGEGRFFDDPDTPDTGCGCPPVVDMGAYEFGGSGPQPCPGDLDCDRDVDEYDLDILLSAWTCSDEGDLNCDGETNAADLAVRCKSRLTHAV